MKRLTALLDLTEDLSEETLSRLVVSKMIWARIDRPSGIVSFRSERNAEDIMNDWSFDMQRYFGPEHEEVKRTRVVKLKEYKSVV